MGQYFLRISGSRSLFLMIGVTRPCLNCEGNTPVISDELIIAVMVNQDVNVPLYKDCRHWVQAARLCS